MQSVSCDSLSGRTARMTGNPAPPPGPPRPLPIEYIQVDGEYLPLYAPSAVAPALVAPPPTQIRRNNSGNSFRSAYTHNSSAVIPGVVVTINDVVVIFQPEDATMSQDQDEPAAATAAASATSAPHLAPLMLPSQTVPRAPLHVHVPAAAAEVETEEQVIAAASPTTRQLQAGITAGLSSGGLSASVADAVDSGVDSNVVMDHRAHHHSHYSLYGMVRPLRSFCKRRGSDSELLSRMIKWFSHDTSEKFLRSKIILAILCASYQQLRWRTFCTQTWQNCCR